MESERRYAYLHGFASSPQAKKGLALQALFRERGLTLELPNLNQPSFSELSHEACLAAITAMDRSRAKAEEESGAKWCFVGSSFGGWLAARWAELHPDRVERLVLLCPGFALDERLPHMVGAEAMARWGREGHLVLPDGAGVPTAVHYAFYEEARRQPKRPAVPCPTLIIHGIRDEVVPIASSRQYAEDHGLRLIELDDEHPLGDSVGRIKAETLGFFGLS